ncbi:DUF4153 domain-containing protein [Brevundimonas vesicularis]|uniref:DUF4153 domain-containing protein n=1 Tax=Brevundimonas vesicularis TaxID=41276 RepID=UPI0038D3E5E2
MNPLPSESHGRASLQGSRALGLARIIIGLVQGALLYGLWLSASAEPMAWPATQPALFAALGLAIGLGPMVLLAGVGRLSLRSLLPWAAIAMAALALLGWHDAAAQTDEHHYPPYLRFPVVAFSAAALFIAHHLVVPAVTSRRWIADFDDYFDTAWKAGVQLALSLGFTLAFWLLFFLGAALFKVIGLRFLQDLIDKEWFSIPVTCLVFAVAVQLTDVRDGLIRGVRTVALMLLSWLLLVMTVLVAGFLLALPFTGLDGLWETGSATALVLSAAAALIILVNTAYQDGREDNLPPPLLRGAVRVASLLLMPLVAIAVWGLALRIGQHGLTPDRIIAVACTLVGAVYAAGYAHAALSPLWRSFSWMKPLERTNVAAAVLTVWLILALFSPLLDPARLSVADQVSRLERGRVAVADFDFQFLRFEAGRSGQAALARLARSDDPAIAAPAREAQRMTSRRPVLPRDQARPVFQTWPAGQAVPEGFAVATHPGDPRFNCNAQAGCVLVLRDLDSDGQAEALLADPYTLNLYRAEGTAWAYTGFYPMMSCDQPGRDPRDLLRNPDLAPAPPQAPDLLLGGRRFPFSPDTSCRPGPALTPE